MSKFCPLCGNEKLEESLFCSDCIRKVEKEYEVKVPVLGKAEDDLIDRKQISSFESSLPNSLARENEDNSLDKQGKKAISKREEELLDEIELEIGKRKRIRKLFIPLLISILLITSAFFLYNKYVINQNLERASWESSLRENSLSGYLNYMNEYPNGTFFPEAQVKMMELKSSEAVLWENIKHSDNTSEIQLFLEQYPSSPYKSMALNRLDSLMWTISLNVNSAQSYSDYMIRSDSGELPGGYYALAQHRYEMLFQSYPVSQEELNNIRLAVDGFYIALSSVDYSKLNEYLASTVYRFFNSGKVSRDKITRELLIAGAKSQPSTIKFTPQIDDLQYQKTYNGNYKTNVPLSKSFVNASGITETIHGYIIHIEMDSEYRIIGIYETKPYDEAV